MMTISPCRCEKGCSAVRWACFGGTAGNSCSLPTSPAGPLLSVSCDALLLSCRCAPGRRRGPGPAAYQAELSCARYLRLRTLPVPRLPRQHSLLSVLCYCSTTNPQRLRGTGCCFQRRRTPRPFCHCATRRTRCGSSGAQQAWWGVRGGAPRRGSRPSTAVGSASRRRGKLVPCVDAFLPTT